MLNRKTIGIVLFFLSGCNQLWGMKKEITINEDQAHYFSVLSLENVKKLNFAKLDDVPKIHFPVSAEKSKIPVVHIKAACTSRDKVFAFDKTGIAIIKARLNSLNIKGDFIFSFREYRDVGYYLIEKANFENSLAANNF